jgi:hypothetical protein
MAHNLHGDIPPDHVELAKELEEMEVKLDSVISNLDKSLYAKSMVCLAADWYGMGDDDKGSQLLEKADRACPGYFDNEMQNHIDEDELFSILVQQMTADILAIAGSLAGT